MRTLLFSFFMTFCLHVSAQNLDQKIVSALENIQHGAITQGVEGLRNAARANVLIAQYYMATCYDYGIGVEKNYQEAFVLYRKAAERGLPDAMLQLSKCYSEGKGVEKNESRSEEWLSRYQQKQGYSQLPDLIALYNEGIKHPIDLSRSSENENTLAANSAGHQNNVNANYKQSSYQPILTDNAQPQQPQMQKSDVDMNIPMNGSVKSNTFAVIIANENYQEETKVDYAIHDGEMFAEYCKKTLGIPKENVHIRKDATFNNIKSEINWMQQVAEAYKGKARFVFYYAGHGFPDETTRNSFLLPVDGNGSISSTGYNLEDLYQQLAKMPSKDVIVFLDACFSGAKRGEGMLASARGIAIKAKENVPTGKVIVLSATNGQQTAYPYNEKGHGMFTYYLLKCLKDTKGSVTLGELYDFVSERVSQQSIVVNSKPQTPMLTPSVSLADDWRTINF